MGVRITTQEHVVAIFDSVSGWAFGPTFEFEYDAEAFLIWAAEESPDLRTLSNTELEALHGRWLEVRASDGNLLEGGI